VANPILAVIISIFLPGIGSVYAGKVMMGIVIFVIYLILAAIYYMLWMNWIMWIVLLIVWVYGLYDAYTTAKATETPAEL
jgi:TM2 domain-containing membrane protein YozV